MIATLQGGHQTLSLGPVAAQKAIEDLETNGGGFFNVNAAHPFENPSARSNLMLILLMACLPAALEVMFSHMIKNHRQNAVIYSVMALMLGVFGESRGNVLALNQALQRDYPTHQ